MGWAYIKELTIAATVENIAVVTAFVDEQLEAMDCPMKAQMQIGIAIDELFSNIAHYAYIDGGVSYDPLTAADPDTSLSADERAIGGLGIFMVKKSMDEISYRYENGSNILSIRKNLRS